MEMNDLKVKSPDEDEGTPGAVKTEPDELVEDFGKIKLEQDSVQVLLQEKQALAIELASKDAQLQELQTNINGLRETNRALAGDLAENNDFIDGLREEYDGDIARLEEEKDVLQNRIDGLDGRTWTVIPPTAPQIQQLVVDAGSIEMILQESPKFHALSLLGTELTGLGKLPAEGSTCEDRNCHYRWDTDRCDCKSTNIVCLVECLECAEKYAKKYTVPLQGEEFPRNFKGEDNGLYIGYCSDRLAHKRFEQMVDPSRFRLEPLIKHWLKHVNEALEHPHAVLTVDRMQQWVNDANLNKPNTVRMFRFIGVYQGLFPLLVRTTLKGQFNARQF